MENIGDLVINLDEELDNLRKCDLRSMDDESLCQLGIRLRLACTVAKQQNDLSAKQSQILAEVTGYSAAVEKEMAVRGYRVVDSWDFADMEPEEIMASIEDAPLDGLMKWYDALEKTAETNEDDKLMRVLIGDEISRRCLAMSGGLVN